MRFVVLASVILVMSLSSRVEAQPDMDDTTSQIDTDGDGISDSEDACPHDPGPRSEDLKKSGCTAKVLAKQWVMNFLVKYAPPGRKTYYKHAEETPEEALTRYDSIAEDLIDVVYDPNTKPLFAGPLGRTQTASLLLGVMFWETSFRKDVDLGLGKYSRGDNGRSWCLMQINIGDGTTSNGFTGEDLVKDRKNCLSEGIEIIRGSFGVCNKLPFEQRLSAYASGSCERGREKSKQRIQTGMRYFSITRRPFTDEEVMTALLPVALPLERPRLAQSE